MRSSYDDIDSPRVRFWGWWPKRKEDKIFLIFNVVFFLFGIFVWPWLPAFHIGIFPAPYFWYLILTAIISIAWHIYTKKYWYAWEDDIPGENAEGELVADE